MIIIKTANGTEFINEAFIKSLTHAKDSAIVDTGNLIKIHQVESVIYTTKNDTEYVDNGLALTAALKDKEYYNQLRQSAQDFAKRLYDRQNELELFILRNENLFTKNYDKNFIERIRDEKNDRGTCEQELFKLQDMPYYTSIRKEADQYGNEIADLIESLYTKISELDGQIFNKNMDIQKLKIEIVSLEGKIKRLSLRGLWERIINKNVSL